MLLVPLALSLGMLFLVLFLRASNQGQFDDLDTPAIKILADETLGRRQ